MTEMQAQSITKALGPQNFKTIRKHQKVLFIYLKSKTKPIRDYNIDVTVDP